MNMLMNCSVMMVIYSVAKSMHFYVYITFDNVNIHKYANQLICILICIFELYTRGQCRSFNLIPNLMFYND